MLYGSNSGSQRRKAVDSDLPPQLFPRILRIQLSQLPQQFFRLLIPRHRHSNLHLDNLVAAHSILSCRRHALLPQPQLLPRLRSWRDLQHAAPINRRHFELRSQCCLECRHRHNNVDVISLTSKQWMLPNADNHIKIADSTAAQPRVPFTRNPNALPIARPRLDANLQRISPLHAALAMAHRTSRYILPRPMASRTSHIKLHPPAGLLYRPLAMALRTLPRSLNIPIAVAIPAHIAPSDIQLHYPAANRRPERNVDLIFKISPRLRTLRHRLASAATSKNAGENVLESAGARAA